VCYNLLQCVAVRRDLLQYVAVCCSVLQCVAVCCSVLRYQHKTNRDPHNTQGLCSAVCCSMLQCVAVCCGTSSRHTMTLIILRILIAACCSMLQCTTVCCSVLQYQLKTHYGTRWSPRHACDGVSDPNHMTHPRENTPPPSDRMTHHPCALNTQHPVLQCIVVCCSVLQCVAVCCSVCCCMRCLRLIIRRCCRVLQFITMYCSVLQCVAVCCSVLQCVAVCCSVL